MTQKARTGGPSIISFLISAWTVTVTWTPVGILGESHALVSGDTPPFGHLRYLAHPWFNSHQDWYMTLNTLYNNGWHFIIVQELFWHAGTGFHAWIWTRHIMMEGSFLRTRAVTFKSSVTVSWSHTNARLTPTVGTFRMISHMHQPLSHAFPLIIVPSSSRSGF